MATATDSYVFTAEIDHVDRENNVYDHKNGTFTKHVPPMTKELGYKPLSMSHSQELFNAAFHAYDRGLKCRILLIKGTKFGTTKGSIRAGIEPHLWQVRQFSGTVHEGYFLQLIRVE